MGRATVARLIVVSATALAMSLTASEYGFHHAHAGGMPEQSETTGGASAEAARLLALVAPGGPSAEGPLYQSPWHIDERRGTPVRDRSGQVRYIRDLPLPLCALTYDMEHGPKRAAALLSQLAVADVRATPFWLGSVAAGETDTVLAFRQAGHDAGIHSWGHQHQPRLSDAAFRKETQRVADLIARVDGAPDSGLYRFPWGEANAREVNALNSMGYTAFYWSVDTSDYLGKSGARVVASGRTCDRGGIVLMHDTQGAIDGCPSLAAALREKGLEPVALTTMLRAFPAQPVFLLPRPTHPTGAGTAVELPPGEVRWSLDGQWGAAVREGVLALWDAVGSSGVRVAGDVVACAWAPSGDCLAVESAEGRIWLLSALVAASGAAGHPPAAVSDLASALAVSPPGSRARAPRFSDDGGALYWSRQTPGGAWQDVGASLRRLSPWGVVRVVGAGGTVRVLGARPSEARAVAVPCLLIAGDGGLRLQSGAGEALPVRVKPGEVATVTLDAEGLQLLALGQADANAAPTDDREPPPAL